MDERARRTTNFTLYFIPHLQIVRRLKAGFMHL